MKKIIGIFVLMLMVATTIPVVGQMNISIKNDNEMNPSNNGDKWVKTFGGNKEEVCNSVMQTSDGGYIFVGETRSFGNGNSDLWLTKIDDSGNKLWDRVYGGEDYDFGNAVQQTSDGGYIITGVSESFGSIQDTSLWLIKTDSKGNLIWEIFGNSGDDRGFDVKELNDGGFVVVGDGRNSKYPDHSDIYIMRTDNNGNILWEKFYDFNTHDHAYSIEQTIDEGFIICGATYSYEHTGYDIVLLKTDSIGEEEWNHIFYVETDSRAHDVRQTSDGGFIVTGYKKFGQWDTDVWIIKTDFEGNKEWDRFIGEDGLDAGKSVFETPDGSFVIAGYQTKITYYDVLLVKFDQDGNEIWKRLIGGFGPEAIYCGQQTMDNGFILGGYKFAGNTCDALLIKTDSEGDVPYNHGRNLMKIRLFDLFPNFFRFLQNLNLLR